MLIAVNELSISRLDRLLKVSPLAYVVPALCSMGFVDTEDFCGVLLATSHHTCEGIITL